MKLKIEILISNKHSLVVLYRIFVSFMVCGGTSSVLMII
jgi:hypothetical protein